MRLKMVSLTKLLCLVFYIVMLRAALLIDLSRNHLSLTAKNRGDSNGTTFFIILLRTTVDPDFYPPQLNTAFDGDKMISVITPAHNEELFIKECLCSVKTAAKEVSEAYDHIVVLNRCTDKTGEIATQLGARIITDDSRNLSRIRNKGAEASKGDILVTIDADRGIAKTGFGKIYRWWC